MNLKTSLSYKTVCITNDFPVHSNDSPDYNSIYSIYNKKRLLEFGCQVWCLTSSGCSHSRLHAALMFTDFVALFQQFVFDSDLILPSAGSALCWSEAGPAPTRELLFCDFPKKPREIHRVLSMLPTFKEASHVCSYLLTEFQLDTKIRRKQKISTRKSHGTMQPFWEMWSGLIEHVSKPWPPPIHWHP